MSYVSKSVAISPPEAASAGCSASCPGEQTDFEGGWARNYTLSASSVSGWRFVKFTWNSVRVTDAGSEPLGERESTYNPSTSTDGVSEARAYESLDVGWVEYLIENVTAHFEPDAPAGYTITTQEWPGIGGNTAGGGTNIPAGSTCSIYAYPSPHYTFVGWELGGEVVSTVTPYSFTVTEDANYIAIFETYTISTAASPSVGGTTSGDGNFALGESCTIEAHPSSGYVFSHWEVNGIDVSYSESYTFEVAGTRLYTAVFREAVTITIRADNSYGRVRFTDGGGWVTEDSKIVAKNSTVGVDANTATSGVIFKYWENSSGVIVLYNAHFPILAETTETYTAVFGVIASAHARLASDDSKPCSFGQVQILQEGETSDAWYRDEDRELDPTRRVVFQQRVTDASIGTFVKWRYRLKNGSTWNESVSPTLNLSFANWDVLALFQRTPTHLLVNSSTVENPAKLVYDPATNKLVADY